jgi:DNA-binding transcriptional LysR family regulator
VRLLLRSARSLTPTDAGSGFYSRAKRAIEEANEADSVARGEGAGLTGRLRISAAVTFARIHVVPRLPRFLAQHPGLDVDLALDDRDIDLIEEGADLSLRMGDLPDSTLTARKIGHSPRLVVATPAYLSRAGEPARPEDVTDHQTVVYNRRGGGDLWSFRQGEIVKPISVQGRIRSNAAEGVRAAVLADAGLALASSWMFTPELASGAVRPVLTDWRLPGIDLWAVFPTGRLASLKARKFAAYIEAALNEPAN